VINTNHSDRVISDSPTSRSAFDLDVYGTANNVGFVSARSLSTFDDVISLKDSVWVPSPHIIITNNHHSRYQYCSTCHGGPSIPPIPGHGPTSYVCDQPCTPMSKPPHYASQSMPRLRSKFSIRSAQNKETTGKSDYTGCYSSQTLPNGKHLSRLASNERGKLIWFRHLFWNKFFFLISNFEL
jgi:hypothetical protein